MEGYSDGLCELRYVCSEKAGIRGTQERQHEERAPWTLLSYCYSRLHRKIIIVFTDTKSLAAALLNLSTTNYNKRKDAHTRPLSLGPACILR